MYFLAWILPVAILVLAGCAAPASRHGTLPELWRQAVPTAGSPFEDVTGSYLPTGEVIGDKMPFLDRRPIESLRGLFFPRDQRIEPGFQIELRRPDDRHLQVLATRAGAILAEVTLEAVHEPETGALLIRRSELRGGSNLPGGSVASYTIRLWRGRDGYLYARMATSAAGITVIVPFVDQGEAWGRWESATPAGMTRAAEELASRERTRVSQMFPDYPALYDRDGAPLTRATFSRRIVVLYFPPRRLPPQPMPSPLRTLCERYSAAHVELITAWHQPAADRVAIERLIVGQALPGRHYFHPVAAPGPAASPGGPPRWQLLPGFASPPPPYFYVLDQDGRIAAVGPTLVQVEGSLRALVAAAAGGDSWSR